MGTLNLVIEDETSEPQPKRFLTLSRREPDGSRSFVQADGSSKPDWAGRWVTFAPLAGERATWEIVEGGLPSGKYFCQLRMIEDRNALPVCSRDVEVPPESVTVEIRPPRIAAAFGSSKDLPG